MFCLGFFWSGSILFFSFLVALREMGLRCSARGLWDCSPPVLHICLLLMSLSVLAVPVAPASARLPRPPGRSTGHDSSAHVLFLCPLIRGVVSFGLCFSVSLPVRRSGRRHLHGRLPPVDVWIPRLRCATRLVLQKLLLLTALVAGVLRFLCRPSPFSLVFLSGFFLPVFFFCPARFSASLLLVGIPGGKPSTNGQPQSRFGPPGSGTRRNVRGSLWPAFSVLC
jgi:hypothetical protein